MSHRKRLLGCPQDNVYQIENETQVGLPSVKQEIAL